MIKIIDKRYTGKSCRLMLLAKEKDAIIVCPNPTFFKENIKKYGMSGIQCISYGEFLEYHDQHKTYVIDEIDGLLLALGGGSIKAYTCSYDG